MEKTLQTTDQPRNGSSPEVDAEKHSDDELSPSSRGLQSASGLPGEDLISTKLIAKMDLRILPTLIVIYLVTFLDRVNIGNALLFNLPQDLGLHGPQTNTALAILFVSYVLFEIPATILMKKIKPHRFLATSMFLCGFLTIMQGLVQNYGGLITTRFLMGIVEAGIYPSCYYLISMWYRRREAQRRFSFFFTGASFAGAFGGLLASAIGLMNGIRGYSAWRWIFILEGLLTCVLSFVASFTVTDFPEDAKWLSENERSIVLSRLANDQGRSGLEEKFRLRDLFLIVKDWKVFLSAPIYFSISVSAYGLAFFIPSIVATYGYTAIQAQLHTVIPWCAALGFALLMAYGSDRAQLRFPFIVIGLVLALSGNIMLFTIHSNRQAEYVGVFLYLMGVISITPIIVCWFSMNLQGHRERAISIPYQVGFGNAAGIVGTFAFPASDAPQYKLGYSLGLGFLCATAAIAIMYFVGYRVSNRHRSARDRYVL